MKIPASCSPKLILYLAWGLGCDWHFCSSVYFSVVIWKIILKTRWSGSELPSQRASSLSRGESPKPRPPCSRLLFCSRAWPLTSLWKEKRKTEESLPSWLSRSNKPPQVTDHPQKWTPVWIFAANWKKTVALGIHSRSLKKRKVCFYFDFFVVTAATVSSCIKQQLLRRSLGGKNSFSILSTCHLTGNQASSESLFIKSSC